VTSSAAAPEPQDLRDQFEARLGAWLATQTCGSPEPLRDAVLYACSSGKRIRPLLCIAAAAACGADLESVIAPAIAIELVHCYSLVHDDLPAMDNDSVRRGRPTVHVMFGEGQAILAGDALLTMAFAALADPRLGVLPADRRLALAAELALAAGALGMIAGQADELGVAAEVSGQEVVIARRIAAGKTGALMRAAARMGGIAAGADNAHLAALTRFGEQYGLAYQVVDDLGDQVKDRALGRTLNYALLLGPSAAAEVAIRMCDAADAALGELGDGGVLAGLREFAISLRSAACDHQYGRTGKKTS
jgi:geranylgeranyl pyrophosphate synthase